MLKTTELIKTKSFKLAVYKKGSIGADKLAIVLPGKLDTKDYPHMRSHVDFLARKGYLALSFDPPGTWESSGNISIYTTSNYLKSVEELIEYYENKPTFLVGHSRGGGIAMLAGTKFADVKRFAAVMSSPTCKSDEFPDKDWKNKGFRISVRDTPKEYKEKTKSFKLPYTFMKDSQQYDMTHDLKVCNKPKLFIAGSKDDIIDPEEVQEAYELSSEPKQFEMLESDHDYRKDKKRINKVNKIIEKFISDKKQ